MAKLSYAAIIERDQRARALAELGLRLDLAELPQLMPRLVDLVAPEHLPLLAESRSILGADGYWLAESDDARRKLIKGAYELHRYKGTPWAIREIVRRLGFGEVRIIEGLTGQTYDGSINYNGRRDYQRPGRAVAQNAGRFRTGTLPVGSLGLSGRPPTLQRAGGLRRQL